MVKDRVWQIVLDLIDRSILDQVEADKYKERVRDIVCDLTELVCDIECDYYNGVSNIYDVHPSHPDDKGGI